MDRCSDALLPSTCLSYSVSTSSLTRALTWTPGTPVLHMASVHRGPEMFPHVADLVKSLVGMLSFQVSRGGLRGEQGEWWTAALALDACGPT